MTTNRPATETELKEAADLGYRQGYDGTRFVWDNPYKTSFDQVSRECSAAWHDAWKRGHAGVAR